MTESKKTIIFTRTNGRLGNQLINYAHLAAYAYEHEKDTNVVNLSFWRFKHLLDEEGVGPYCSFFSTGSIPVWLRGYHFVYSRLHQKKAINYLCFFWGYFLSKLAIFLPSSTSIVVGKERIMQRFSGERFDKLPLEGSALSNVLASCNNCFIAGWGISAWDSLEKHQHKVKAHLQLNREALSIAQPFFKTLRERYDYIIGVHIRQGDYKQYREGEYYFEAHQYVTWIQEAVEVFADKGKVGVIVTSDTVQDETLFCDDYIHFSTGTAGRGHYTQSMVELSMCDLILGPPSTFSLWSAFMGDRLLLPLVNASQNIRDSLIMKNHLFEALEYPEMYKF